MSHNSAYSGNRSSAPYHDQEELSSGKHLDYDEAAQRRQPPPNLPQRPRVPTEDDLPRSTHQRVSGYDVPQQYRHQAAGYDQLLERRPPADYARGEYDSPQSYRRQTSVSAQAHQAPPRDYDLPPAPGHYSSTLYASGHSRYTASEDALPPRPPSHSSINAPHPTDYNYDGRTSAPPRDYMPLRSEPATPAPATPAPPSPAPLPGYRSSGPGPSPNIAAALLPPHMRAIVNQEGRRQYTPSPLSVSAGQFEDADIDDLADNTQRLNIGRQPTGPSLPHNSTGPTTTTDTSTAVDTPPPFGSHNTGNTRATAVSTPSTDNSKGSKPHHPGERLEALPLTSFIVRPGFGKQGTPLTVESNYFMVRALDGRGKIIYHYNVEIDPVVRSASQKYPRQLLRSVWEQLALEYETKKEWDQAFAAAAFDGRRNAYTPVKFPTPDDEVTTLTVSLSSTREVQRQKDESSGDEYRRFRVSFKLVAKIDLEAVMRFCRADSDEKRDARAEEACLTGVMATNVLLRDVPSKTYTQVGATGNKFYTLENARPLPHGAVVLNGFMQSFRYSNSGYPLLNIDLGFSAFLMSGPALDVISKILGPGSDGNRGGPRGGPRGGFGGGPQQTEVLSELTEMQVGILKRKLRGARFTVTHRQSSRLHTVITVTSRSSQEIMFQVEGKNGEPERTISVAQYYQEYYACQVRFPRLPCIQYGKRAYIPLEFVKIEDFNSLPPTNLSADQIAEMIMHSAVAPPVRKQLIMKWREKLAHEKQPKIADWGLLVNKNMVKVQARVLSAPQVKYNHRVIQPREGKWNLRGLRFIRDGNRPLKNWAVISFDRYCDIDSMERWITFLVRRLEQLGVKVANPRPKLIAPVDPRIPGKITQQLQFAAREAFMVDKEAPQLICAILPGKDAWLYEQIKRIAFTELKAPVATQCMQAAKIKNQRGIDAYTDNLAMKIAQKLGGLSHQVSISDLPGMEYGKTMIFGADLGHPPFRPNSQEPTVACSIATYNAECDAYSAQIRLQEGRSEIIVDLSSMVEEHLRIFAKENDGEYPERILVFRDGISEGQYAAALQYEHNAIVTACSRILTGYRPLILVCVCARRHNTRFFCTDGGQMTDRTGNLPPGLVVDRTVTHPFAFDFFLQAHAGLVGTARPTHYICLLDELGITPDQLQQLCNALCYSFARCTRSVSLVPVCYMADLVCQKARLIVQSNEGTVSPSEFSGSRAQSRFGPGPPTSVAGTEATTVRRQRFEEKHDILHIQKILSKNPELARVAWWM